MIHKSLKHVHIVGFEDVFEDSENVYFVLELCHNGVRIERPQGLTRSRTGY